MTRLRFGMLTPSSNTVLEPVTAAMLADVPDVTMHVARFRVTEIALSASSNRQFDDREILRAAALLTDAKVDVIAWNGTSASWLGLDRDERLVTAIESATGIRAATCVLGYRDLFQRRAARRIGLVTPYTHDVQRRIIETWTAAGMPIGPERHSGRSENFSFAEVPGAEIERMIRAVVADGADAVAIVCTNMAGATLAPRLEAELGVPIYDSVAVTLRACFDRLSLVPSPTLRPWGRVFDT
jgi:maleate isomerase